jgi:1-phosphatidylinositol phosphodiesterase
LSVGFKINFHNNTDTTMTLTAKVYDMGDWESSSHSNPDVDIKGYVLNPYTITPNIHLERANSVDTAPFRVTATVGGKTVLEFNLDGCDATALRDTPGVLVGTGAGEYAVLQVVTERGEIQNGDPDYRRMSVFITPWIDPAKWMADFPDRTLMSLNVPGTHDSATYGGTHEEGTECQQLTFTQQLEAGVRFLDLRLILNPKARPDDIGFFHAHYFQKLWLNQDLVLAVNGFLDRNPTECVVFCVNQEHGLGDPLNDVLHKILVANFPGRLFDHNTDQILTTPLKSLAGCVVLLRQDKPQNFGLDVSNWPDDSAYSATPFAGGKGTIAMQNAYRVVFGYNGIPEKWEKVTAHLKKAVDNATKEPYWWYLNWISCSSRTAPAKPWFPWGYATDNGRGLNFLLAQHLVLNTTRDACRYGTVIMDYPDVPLNNTLIQLLLAWNRFTPLSPTP